MGNINSQEAVWRREKRNALKKIYNMNTKSARPINPKNST